jgi:hypothetical protein
VSRASAVSLHVHNEDRWREVIMIVAAAVRAVPAVSLIVSLAHPGEWWTVLVALEDHVGYLSSQVSSHMTPTPQLIAVHCTTDLPNARSCCNSGRRSLPAM